ncbi:hypothetical protein Tcan_01832 [Toxocara canis]|uniref:Uncharacterized protein n=1 Tax=Toxocara canis TaxID=6265 RepID=A0A0B2USC1_TOXCA|nr:hypothetical protein Tcan_01832 [Toxocara canis]
MMSAIPGFGDEERYEEPMPPHEDEAEHTDGAHPDSPAEANANDSNDTPKESNGAHVVSTSEMPSTASTQVSCWSFSLHALVVMNGHQGAIFLFAMFKTVEHVQLSQIVQFYE